MSYRVAIDDVVLNFSNRIHSHKSGWARMQKCMIQDWCMSHPPDPEGDDIELLFTGERDRVRQARTWMIAHDLSFSGKGYNLFGGWSADIYQSLMLFLEHPNVISLERPMPNLRELLEPRAAATKSNLAPANWDEIERKCAQTPVLRHEDLTSGRLVTVVGDSHAIAQYRRNRLVLRNDGLTMHRMVEDGIDSYLPNDCAHLVVVAGSIDIRHHLLRRDNPIGEIRRMLAKLAAQLEQLAAEHRIMSYEVVMPYPVEFEGRRIPQTGYYKGTPFYGSQADRAALVRAWITEAERLFGREKLFAWPEHWYEMDPELYAKTYMERPGSVHLSPFWHSWDYETNQPNPRLEAEYL